jgi:hypothetical protein
MNQNLRWAYLLFGFAVLAFLVTGVLLEGALASVPPMTQRIMNLILIILPTVVGSFLGVLSLVRPPRRWLLAIPAILLNGLTALFFIFLISFAG